MSISSSAKGITRISSSQSHLGKDEPDSTHTSASREPGMQEGGKSALFIPSTCTSSHLILLRVLGNTSLFLPYGWETVESQSWQAFSVPCGSLLVEQNWKPQPRSSFHSGSRCDLHDKWPTRRRAKRAGARVNCIRCLCGSVTWPTPLVLSFLFPSIPFYSVFTLLSLCSWTFVLCGPLDGPREPSPQR